MSQPQLSLAENVTTLDVELIPTHELTPWHLRQRGGGDLYGLIEEKLMEKASQAEKVPCLGPLPLRDFGVLYANYHEQVKIFSFVGAEKVALDCITDPLNFRACACAVKEIFPQAGWAIFPEDRPGWRVLAESFGLGYVVKGPELTHISFPPTGGLGHLSLGFLRPGERPAEFVYRTGRPQLQLPGCPEPVPLLTEEGPGLEEALQQSFWRPVVFLSPTGEGARKEKAFFAARYGASLFVPLLGPGDSPATFFLLQDRLRETLSLAEETGLPEENLLFDLTGSIPAGLSPELLASSLRRFSSEGRFFAGVSYLPDNHPTLRQELIQAGAAFLPATGKSPRPTERTAELFQG